MLPSCTWAPPTESHWTHSTPWEASTVPICSGATAGSEPWPRWHQVLCSVNSRTPENARRLPGCATSLISRGFSPEEAWATPSLPMNNSYSRPTGALTVCQALRTRIASFLSPRGTALPISQMGKPKFREVKQLAQSHTATGP